ncbi:hypothetical protein, partial [Mycobacterium tuberculosis]
GAAWHHRNDIGVDNNKLFSLGNDGWSNPSSFILYAIETEPEWQSDGDSRAALKWRPDGAGSGEYGKNPINGGIIQDADLRGEWVEYIVHFKTASGFQETDGVVEMWVDGNQIFDYHDLNTWPIGGNEDQEEFNSFNHGYIMGWFNSGMNATSATYIDDFTLLSGPPASLLEEEEPVVNTPVDDEDITLFYDSFHTGDDTYSNEFFEWGSSRGYQHGNFA